MSALVLVTGCGRFLGFRIETQPTNQRSTQSKCSWNPSCCKVQRLEPWDPKKTFTLQGSERLVTQLPRRAKVLGSHLIEDARSGWITLTSLSYASSLTSANSANTIHLHHHLTIILGFFSSLFNLVQPCWPSSLLSNIDKLIEPIHRSCSILSCRITCLQFGKSVALQAWITTGRSSIGLPRSHHHRREPCSSSINEAFPPSFEQQKLKINKKHQQTASFGLFGWPCWLCRYTDHISKTVSLCSHWPTTRHKLSSCHKCSLAQSCQYHLQKAIAGARKHENPCNHIYLVTYMLNQR